jgi:hypothetical protein
VKNCLYQACRGNIVPNNLMKQMESMGGQMQNQLAEMRGSLFNDSGMSDSRSQMRDQMSQLKQVLVGQARRGGIPNLKNVMSKAMNEVKFSNFNPQDLVEPIRKELSAIDFKNQGKNTEELFSTVNTTLMRLNKISTEIADNTKRTNYNMKRGANVI